MIFGFNSTMCCHIAGLRLSSDQVTYDFKMDADQKCVYVSNASAYQTFLATYSVY